MSDDSEPSGTSPKLVGTVSEAMVMARLIELGYAVSIPYGDGQRYDFIVDDGSSLRRAQVKTGRLRNGYISFATRSTNWHTREHRDYKGQADDFLVYCPETRETYRLAVNDCSTSGSVRLRVASEGTAQGRPGTRWARECRLGPPAVGPSPEDRWAETVERHAGERESRRRLVIDGGEEQWLTAGEAARYGASSKSEIVEALRSGHLGGRKIEGAWHTTPDRVDAWIVGMTARAPR